ncbi:uncharacterized protein LOC125559795 [Nematostella vectensis]|uniref:uncharacterized protein LOC125559795 n=1 Tax=Nematostella vectensis TaxID=45351 RepID=UPI0020770FB9|nr:uncharacterized protein LOC125559795 [Nematostella vectensis]
MGKSRAEIQRAYRERKKGKDSNWQQNESIRVQKYYTPASKHRRLKSNLKAGHVVIQMDFAENYNCQSCEEVQSAHWNGPTMVSLHPVVVYYKAEGKDDLKHKSFAFVSEELSHNATAVYAILGRLNQDLKDLVPDLAIVHYWTDSPTSQYRNKTIFAIVANHKEEFVVPVRWNYFEAGHGKGPCDGVGGAAKRMADEAVRSGKVVIDDAHSFFVWATEYQSSVTYIYYSTDDLKMASARLDKYNGTQTVPGTMSMHAICAVDRHTVLTRVTSCYCPDCLSSPKDSHCAWEAAMLTPPSALSLRNELALKVDDFVAAAYEGDWYVGKVQQIDQEDGEALVTFMSRSGTTLQSFSFTWPAREYVIWIKRDMILCVIEPPARSSKTETGAR